MALRLVVEFDRGETDVLAKPRREFARDAHLGKRVGAVGRDLEVEEGVAAGERLVDRLADGRLAREEQEAGVFAAEAEFVGRAEHAVGSLAANLRLLDLEVAGQHGTGKRDRHAVARIAVVRAADDGAHAAVSCADVDGADRELVGVGMLGARENGADDDILQRRERSADDALDLEAEEGDGVFKLVG